MCIPVASAAIVHVMHVWLLCLAVQHGKSCGLCSYGRYSDGISSYRLYSDDICSYGLNDYGLYALLACVVMACVVRAHVVMVYTAMACRVMHFCFFCSCFCSTTPGE